MSNDNSDNKSLMQFPCDFQMKIIGTHTETFVDEIAKIISRHFPDMPKSAMSTQQSQNGNFLSITARLHVLDQKTLDALYLEVTKHPDIKMVL